jgi:ceramide glucosyltransferase
MAGATLALEVLRAHRQLGGNVDPSVHAEEPPRYPSITVIRPIRGLDVGAEENLRAALDTGYPGEIETLFVLDDDQEPTLPLIRRAIQEIKEGGWSLDARVLFSGRPPPGRTGKLNAMIVGLEQARGELVAFADSDIRPDREALRVLVRTLLSAPDFGAAFAPVVVALPPKTVGDAGYALLLNGLYTPAFNYVAHHNHGSMPFIMGQLMVFRRDAIRAIGGLESAEGQLVDDMYLGERITRAGYRNVVSPHAVPIIQENLPLREFLSIYVRWLTFSRSGLPGLTFKVISWLRGLVFWAGFALTVGAILEGSWLTAALGALAPLLTAASINGLYRRQTGVKLGLYHAWVGFALLMAAPLVMAWILLRREVEWRGRRYSLDTASRLAEQPSATIKPAVAAGPAVFSVPLMLRSRAVAGSARTLPPDQPRGGRPASWPPHAMRSRRLPRHRAEWTRSRI